MVTKVKMTKPEYVTMEPGEYGAVLDEIKEQVGKYGPMLRFVFRIADGEPYEGLPVSLVCSAYLTPGNRLDKILQGMGSSSLEVGDELDLETMKGKPTRVYVENFRDGETTYNNVTKVRRLRDDEPVPKLSKDTRQASPKSSPQPKKDASVAPKAPVTPKPGAPSKNTTIDLGKDDIPF